MNNIVNEILKEIIQGSQLLKEAPEEGAGERERVLRLPNVFASEISVGQKPNSEERSAFQTWMQHIEGNSPDEKIKNIQAFFESDVENYTISETLSHLMFMNSFVFIMKEFNPSVSGFLWEPLLAGLFGGEGGYGKQIPAGSEHDIADIRVYTVDGKEEPYSLKVLSGGDVKGSFTDLANHFKMRATEPMIYEIIFKGSESTMEFYKFDITKETVWDILGGFKYKETLETEPVSFSMNPEKYPDIVQVDGKNLQIRQAVKRQTGWQKEWVTIASKTRQADERYQVKKGHAKNIVERHMNLKYGEEDVVVGHEIDPAGVYSATLAVSDEIIAKYKPTEARTNMSKKIWGDDEEYAKWQRLHSELEWQQFWEAVSDETDGASGYVKTEQFYIPEAQWRKGGSAYATLVIDNAKVQEIFEKSAQRMGKELTDMFNHLADLTDNIGRFFLSNCGGAQKVQKCDKKDAANRGTAATEAKGNATDLKTAVDASIEKAAEQDGGGAAPATTRGVKRGGGGSASSSGGQEESKQPIILDKLIEHMLNKKFN